MKLTATNSKFFTAINMFLVAATIGVLVFEVHVLTRARGSAGGGASESPAVSEEDIKASRCTVYMLQFSAEKQRDLSTFINNTFRDAKPNTELIEEATQQVREYRRKIKEELKKFTPEAAVSYNITAVEKESCERVMEKDYEKVLMLVKQHIVQTAYAKKSVLLLAKYKQINGKLGALNSAIGQMAGYMGTFAQQLSCFATKCTKG